VKNSTSPTTDDRFPPEFVISAIPCTALMGSKCSEVYASGHLYNGSGCKVTFVVRLLKDQGRAFVPSACFGE
jgi:hypothetical protein